MRDNSQRAKVAVIFIFIVMALQLVMLISGIIQYSELTAPGATTIDFEGLQFYPGEIREGLIALLYMVFLLVSGIIFIRWFRRAYYNIGKFVPKKHTDGWAAGAWFVPIVSLFWPYQIMTEIHKKTEAILKENSVSYQEPQYSTIGWWWTFWIISTVFDQISSRIDGSMGEKAIAVILVIASSVASILAGFLVIRIIQNYSKLEDKLYNLKTANVEMDVSDLDDILDAGM